MTTKVLRGTYPNGYSVDATIEKVRVTPSGDVEGVGLSGGGVTLTNGGSIVVSMAGRGGFVGSPGGPGYDGVLLEQISRVTNENVISGGTGGLGGNPQPSFGFSGYAGGVGGVGVDLRGGGRLANKGLIEGGVGGEGPDGGYGGPGGVGVSLEATGSILNTGTIEGGSDGSGPEGPGDYGGGVGVYLSAAARVVNLGSIHGGDGAAGAGDGVVLSAGGVVANGDSTHTNAGIAGQIGVDVRGSAAVTVTNFGTIDGSTTSVQFASAADRLVAMPGAAFIGAMEGGGGTLQLDGGTGSISGIGGGGALSGDDQGSFSGFATYEFAAGGNWTAAGVNLAAGNVARDAGALTITGGVTLTAGSVLVETHGGDINVDARATVSNAGKVQADGPGGIVIQDGVDNTGKLIAKGGDLTITGAVTGAGSANIEGGVLHFEGVFTENVAFVGADPSGTLALKQATAYDGKVLGFSTDGETALDLQDVGFTNANEASFRGDASGGVLKVSDGTNTAKIHLTGDFVGDTFTARADAHGGVIVTASDPGASASAAQLVQAIASFGAGADPPSALQARLELVQADPLIAPSVLRTLSNGAARG